MIGTGAGARVPAPRSTIVDMVRPPHPQRLLRPLDATRDGARFAVPARIFPWTGFGFGLLAVGAVPVLLIVSWVLMLAGAGSRVEAESTAWAAAGLSGVLLLWLGVHLGRLGALRHRLGTLDQGVAAPPPQVVAECIRRDRELHARDDRLPPIRFLSRIQMIGTVIGSWILDVWAALTPPFSGGGTGVSREDIDAGPRRAFTTTMQVASFWSCIAVGFLFIGAIAESGLAAVPAAQWCALAGWFLLFAALWVKAGLMRGLDQGLANRLGRITRLGARPEDAERWMHAPRPAGPAPRPAPDRRM